MNINTPKSELNKIKGRRIFWINGREGEMVEGIFWGKDKDEDGDEFLFAFTDFDDFKNEGGGVDCFDGEFFLTIKELINFYLSNMTKINNIPDHSIYLEKEKTQ